MELSQALTSNHIPILSFACIFHFFSFLLFFTSMLAFFLFFSFWIFLINKPKLVYKRYALTLKATRKQQKQQKQDRPLFKNLHWTSSLLLELWTQEKKLQTDNSMLAFPQTILIYLYFYSLKKIFFTHLIGD